jgi:hypothetical protein
MEFMARVINAWDAHKNESLLPPGYRFYDTSMPAPPEGCDWAFDIQQQAWFARNRCAAACVAVSAAARACDRDGRPRNSLPPPLTNAHMRAHRTSMRVASRLNDGHRYLLAVKYLPTGWELG